MKGKKFLAGILSAAMVLATMAVPAFADDDVTEVNSSAGFYSAIKAADRNSTIKLTSDITLVAEYYNDNGTVDTGMEANRYKQIGKDCTIDLNGHKLEIGWADALVTSYKVTFTSKQRAKITWNDTSHTATISDSPFRIENNGGFSFENIDFEGRKAEYAVVNMNTASGTCSFDNCAYSETSGTGMFIVTNGVSNVVTVNNSQISATEKFLQNGTCYISGEDTSISGGLNGTTKIYKAGNATIPSWSGVTAFVATVTSTTGTTAYSSIDTAFGDAPAGSTITLYDDVAPTRFENEVTDATTLDLNGHILYVNEGTTTHDCYWGLMTFKNGTLQVNETEASTAIFNAWDKEDDLVFDNVVINAPDLEGTYLIGSNRGKITLQNGTKVNVGKENGPTLDLSSVIGVGMDDLVIDNSNITVYNTTGHVIITNTYDIDVTITGNSTISATNVQSCIFLNDNDSLTIGENVTITTSGIEPSRYNPNGDGIVLEKDTTYTNNSNNVNTTVKGGARIGNVYYGTLNQALAAATAGDEIVMLSDATISSATTVDDKITNAKELNLNGKTLTMAVNGIHFGATDIVGGTDDDTRGKIIMTSAASGGQGVIYVCYGNGGTMNIKNVDIDATALNNGSVIEQQSFGGPNYVILNHTKIDAQCTEEGLKNVIVTYDDKFEMNNNSEIIATNVGHAINTSNAEVVIDKSTVTATNCEDCIYSHGNENAAVTITGASTITASGSRGDATWNPTAADILLKGSTPYTKANEATVNASVYRPVTATSVADELMVKFVPTANEREYDIVVVPEENTKTINRLMTADLTFAFSGTAEGASRQSYEIIPEDGVNVQKDGDLYHFNLDGVNEADKSGVEVKLGTVKLGGYGTFNFALADSDDTNARRIFTAAVETNIATECSGTALTAGGNMSDVTIALPKAKLTINIEFPNSINDNANAYQKMYVDIKGGDVNKTIKLGTDATMASNAYKVEETLPLSSYNITVYGDGYRTARYTVQLTEDKTLSFWNDAKVDSKKKAIEENVSEAVASTFLAGELVDDGEINLYDLNAVVSYFGKKAPNTTDEWDLACYDLDRNGIIDSRDVAFVLVSWGN